MKQCCWTLLHSGEECDKPGVCSIDWPDSDGTLWYCAEHYDLMIENLKESGRIAVLKGKHA